MTKVPGHVDLVLRGGYLPDGRGPFEIAIAEGRISEISSLVRVNARSYVDLGGKLVAPGFVDGHIYADKAFLSDEVKNIRPEAFDEHALLAAQVTGAADAMTLDRVEQRARRLLRQAIRHGTTVLRAVVDVYPEIGTSRIELFLGLKEEFARWIDLKIVAFPQFGVVRSPGTFDLLEEALALGADTLGGAPSFDSEYEQHLDLLFDLAHRHSVPVHFSLDHDLTGHSRAENLEVWGVAQRAAAIGYQGRVTVGHLCALDSMEPDEAQRAIDAINRAGLHVMVFASAQLYRQGRPDRKNVRRGLTRIKELLQAGVNVVYASNNVRDAFNPFGNADMLLEGLTVAQASHLASDEELQTIFAMATTNAAHALGLGESYGLEAGKAGDLVVFDAPSVAEALRSQAEKAYVLKHGKVVVLNQRTSHFVANSEDTQTSRHN